jgi:hypothetical protein
MRQVTVTIPDEFYPTLMEYLKNKPDVSVDEHFEYFDKTVPKWQQDLVIERIKNSKPEDYVDAQESLNELKAKYGI